MSNVVPIKFMRESGELMVPFTAPLVQDGGFLAALVSGHARVTYHRDDPIEDGGKGTDRLVWFVEQIYLNGERVNAEGRVLESRLVEIERNDKLYIPIWGHLDDDQSAMIAALVLAHASTP